MNINQIPQIINNFITASNKPDPVGYVNCFTEDAVVIDEGQTRKGKDAIKKWSDQYHFAAHVTLEPREVKEDINEITVTCKLDGDYDKTGLPDPLLLDYHFHIKNDLITYLTID
ncbi:MAG: hypothetical protein K0S61_4671 [Anaerocolumna sp.]|jgi:uncharacterized protein (TIGR02246 family)|nr:hypothetical protein [Anaerocolumna sp.]